MKHPLTDEVAAALAQFFHAGAGPSHSRLTSAFTGAGYSADDPYDARLQTPNKETRVLTVCRAAIRRPQGAAKLVENLLLSLRMRDAFTGDEHEADVRRLRQSLRRAGHELDQSGYTSPIGDIDLSTGGREALEEQLERIRRSTDDPALLLGSAKDLLEAVAKFALEEEHMLPPGNPNFNQLWYLARERLGVLPQQVSEDLPGAKQAKKILGSSWVIAEQVNELRNMQGTGHGRTLPTAISASLALMVVREACSVAQFMLTQIDQRR
ncbi:abortive infection family protein [Streptomyces fradiae]|uniref:abortive infection family protein n=1 Tax=Streptomyces fradiae TaxID=1906 RepID=UPI003660623D